MKNFLVFGCLLLLISGCSREDVHKYSLEGIDVDNSGVRDDLQAFIYERYPEDKLKREALFERAKGLQASILAGASLDKEKMFDASFIMIDASEAMRRVFSDPLPELKLIEEKAVNTDIRVDAFVEFNRVIRDDPEWHMGKECDCLK